MRQIIRFGVKEIKHFFRDKQSFIFVLIFPLILMGVLGTALTGAFNNERSPVEMDVLYKTDANDVLDDAFASFTSEVDDRGLHFQVLDTDEKGEEMVDNGEAAGFVYMDADGIDLYLQDAYSLESNILKSTLGSFTDTYNLANEIIQTSPNKADVLTSNGEHEFIQEHAIDSDETVGSMDYYVIVMTTMFVFLGAMFSSGLIAEERVRHTDVRLIIAPVPKRRILIGKVGGFVVIFSFFIFILFLFSLFVYNANWGEHLGLVALVLLSEIIFTVCFGMGIGYMMQSSGKANVFIMIVVQVSAFFGGAFFKLANPEGVMKVITKLSPLEWQNNALLNLIHANDMSHIVPTLLLNIGVGALFLFIPMLLLRNREGLL